MELINNEELLYLSRWVTLEIDEIRYGILDREWNLKNMRAAFTRVYFPLEGEGILTFGKEQVTLRPGNIYIVPSELNFSGFCPQSLHKIYVHLTLRRPDGSDLLSGINRCLVLPNSEERIRQAEELYRNVSLASVMKLKLLLYELLWEAISMSEPELPESKPYTEHTKAALAYIDKHLHAGLTIEEISSALFVSKLVLQKRFREDLGKSLGKYIDERIMSEAERALLDPKLSIKEISDRLGFCDQFYFSRKFTETHGMPPRTFRQMHNQS